MSEQFIQVQVSQVFRQKFKTLAKKNPNVQKDVQPFVEQLERGEILGDRIAGIGYEVFKLRIRNSNARKGKSGGYRVIYYVKTEDLIILLSIYSKSEQVDIAANEIRSIIAKHDRLEKIDC
jgi:mRNA-degrading endonuclease RelE of RelBE toxin-antitoxin system